MNKITRIVLTAACILGGLISFLHIMEGYKYVIGEIWAPVHVNIEIDQKFAHNLSLFLPQQKELYWLSPTTDFDADTRTIIMYRQLTTHGFYRGISIRAPEREAAETMAGIDNVSIFIGNKLFYFAASDIQAWKPSTENGYTFFAVPGLHYTPSLAIKNWTNYYGDFNLLLMGFCDFLLRPVRYAPAYFFLACLLYLYRKRLYAAYQALYKKNGTWLVLFVLVVLFGFAMRINGYVRHSGWSDELYAATVAGNPNMPLIQTFTDSGNPPFYFMILRAWFMLFGWSEEAGTALSVLFGTGAIISLYFFIEPFYGRKTALLAAFFMAVCMFAVGYSQEMRAYIVKMFLAPFIAGVFFKLLKAPSIPYMLLYIVLSVCIVNAHYYGILFIMANFLFFIAYHIGGKSFTWKKLFQFLAVNSIIALSFMPFFLYQIIERQYYFDRPGTIISQEYTAILAVMIILIAAALVYRKKLINIIAAADSGKTAFCAYIVFMPCLIFMLAYAISRVKPMLSFRYLMPVNLPFFLAAAAVVIHRGWHHKQLKPLCIFLIWSCGVCLYETRHNGGNASIPGNGTEAYKEAREYIARDAAAHRERRAAMLDNAPEIAAYYGFEDLPAYSPEESFDVLYVLNNIFFIHEPDMYGMLQKQGIADTGLLKIRVDEDEVVFKKIMTP